MLKFLAILFGRIAGKMSKATKRGGGSTIPGLTAEKIDPNIVAKLAKMLPDGVILITGTNGKTTTAKMLATIFESAGVDAIYNFAGSNLSRGIATLLINQTNFWGTKMKGQIGIFEVDEATMPEITSKLTPRAVIVTNLFRDQLDRYGELDKTAVIIGNSLENLPDTKVFLNADDPLVATLVNFNKNAVYFGLNAENIITHSVGAIDSKECVCGGELTFEARYFGHLGKYKCKKCGYKRPEPSYFFDKLKLNVENSEAEFVGPQGKANLNLGIPGLYNLYNALAASAVAEDIGVPLNVISYAIGNVTAAFGRMEKISFENKNIYILLVKNPTGFTQSIETLTYDKKPKKLLIALNDNFADGTDVSWIWDAELELLKDNAKNVIVSGIRADDMLLRLKYAGFDMKATQIENNIPKAMDLGISGLADGETLYILPTYTAMLEIRRGLAKMGLVKGLLQ